MSYSTSSPPTKVTSALGSGKSVWFYSSTDDDSTVIAASYITNAASLGMKVGDCVLIWDSTTPKGSVAFVTAVASTGSTMTFAAVA